MSRPSVEICPDRESLAETLAEWIVARHEETNGPFALNLSGGSTPKRLYEVLASEIIRRKIDWTRVHIFFGDERFVPKDHPDSNYGMIDKAMISRVPIPAENVHAIDTGLATPEAAAAAYEATLKKFLGKDTLDMARPIFAVTLLGLGEDGHTASLFPGTAALREREKWVTAVVGAKPEPRISMTFPVLDSSRDVVFLVAGAGKRAIAEAPARSRPGHPGVQRRGAGRAARVLRRGRARRSRAHGAVSSQSERSSGEC